MVIILLNFVLNLLGSYEVQRVQKWSRIIKIVETVFSNRNLSETIRFCLRDKFLFDENGAIHDTSTLISALCESRCLGDKFSNDGGIIYYHHSRRLTQSMRPN